MAKPFDSANKHIVDGYPGDWLTLGELPAGTTTEVVDSDLSAVTTAADKLIRVAAPDPYIAHLEFQTGPDPELDERVLVYKVLARRKLRLPVMSVVFLLRPQALTPRVKGRVTERLSPDQFLDFGYKLVRVWELPPKMILAGGIGTLPLAPISNVTESEVPGVIAEMTRRFNTEVSSDEAREMWMATQILMGLRYSREKIHQLLRGVQDMEESTTYQEIMEKGMDKGGLLRLRAAVLRGATLRFGTPDPQTRARFDGINEIHQLDNMNDALVTGAVKDWAELLNLLR